MPKSDDHYASFKKIAGRCSASSHAKKTSSRVAMLVRRIFLYQSECSNVPDEWSHITASVRWGKCGECGLRGLLASPLAILGPIPARSCPCSGQHKGPRAILSVTPRTLEQSTKLQAGATSRLRSWMGSLATSPAVDSSTSNYIFRLYGGSVSRVRCG